MSDAKKFPAVGLLAVFGLGSAAAAGARDPRFSPVREEDPAG